MMNDSSQVINAEALSIVPAKRKRGRPRKYPLLDDPNSFLGDGSPSNGGDEFHVPPGYRTSNGSKSRQVYPSDGSRDGMTGQAVSGFLEGEFDGGYLLTVRVRNSDTLLRGVVFKPGRFVPVSAENDVAPNVHMIKRNNTTFQSENYGRAHGGSHSRPREKNGVAYPSASPSAGSVASKSKIMSPAPLQAVSSASSRGNVVPLVLQPLSSANDGALTHDQRASVGNRDSYNSSPSPSEETEPVPLRVVHPVVQSTPSEKQAPKSSENDPHDGPSIKASYEIETKPVISPPCKPAENLVTEVIKSTQIPSQVDNVENSQAVGKSSSAPEDGAGTGEQSRVFEPFQATEQDTVSLSNAVQKPLESERTGKMTELLQAVQENAMKNQKPEPE